MSSAKIPFNRPYLTGSELEYVKKALWTAKLAGDGEFTSLCHHWIEENSGTKRALLTHSCTAALEMAALLLDIAPGDEIIMPSYTFVSTANAFVLRGGIPVFVDIRRDTMNIDETLIEAAITPRTRAIAVVHYAGVACEMDAIMEIAKRDGLAVVEDAAQGVGATYKGKVLGSIGDLGAYSFHETKNIVSGEGGALLVNRPDLVERAEIIRQKGTDRGKFVRGEVDKYSWQDVGSSFLPSEILAAFLWAQLEKADAINLARLERWRLYHRSLEALESDGLLRRPGVPADCVHNAHMYYVIVPSAAKRMEVLDAFRQAGIGATFHYIPLHSSPAGLKYGRVVGPMTVTDTHSERLVRLPLYADITAEEQQRAIAVLESVLRA
jgi:dTDP-4-amino-4,6-dideoxygalactose transaminase